MENEYHIITEGIKRVVSRDELEDLNTSGKDAKFDVEWYHSHGYSVDTSGERTIKIGEKINLYDCCYCHGTNKKTKKRILKKWLKNAERLFDRPNAGKSSIAYYICCYHRFLQYSGLQPESIRRHRVSLPLKRWRDVKVGDLIYGEDFSAKVQEVKQWEDSLHIITDSINIYVEPETSELIIDCEKITTM